MATWFAQNSSVNIDSVNQWNSNANGSGSWLTWASLAAGDVLMWNGKTAIAINVNVTCASIRNTTFGGATTNGTGTISNGVTLTCDIYCATSSSFLTLSGTASAAIVGTLYGTSVNAYSITMSSSGTLTITGNLTSDTFGFVIDQTSGTVTLTGNILNTNTGTNILLYRIQGGTLNVTGNVTGGAGLNAGAIHVLTGTSSINITGNVTGGALSEGIRVVSGGATIKVTGNCIASAWPAIGSQLSPTTSKVLSYGDAISSSTGAVGIAMPCVLINAVSTLTHTYRVDNSGSPGAARSLYTGGVNLGQPTAANVRTGTVYGAANEYTGTLAVPSPTLVAIGVSTDNTVGSYAPSGASAADVADAVWDEARSGHTTAGTFGKTSEWVASGDTAGVTELLTRIPDATPGTEGGLPVLSADLTVAVELDSTATAALVDLIWDEPLTGATHNVATSSGKRLRQTTAFQQIDSTVIDAAATSTTFVTGLTSSVDDFYNDSMLVFTDGALAGQVRAIYDYIGATKTIILEEALTSAPVNGVAFAIVSLHIHPVSQIQSGLATAAALATESTKINRIEAVATGTVTGAGTSTEVFVGPSATLTITVDASGNRSAVVVT